MRRGTPAAAQNGGRGGARSASSGRSSGRGARQPPKSLPAGALRDFAESCLCGELECRKWRFQHECAERFALPVGSKASNVARALAIVSTPALKIPLAKQASLLKGAKEGKRYHYYAYHAQQDDH